MAAMVRGPQTRMRMFALAAEPNVIPFIDVLLVLLMIFMVTAPTPTIDIRVDLPPPHPVYTPRVDQRPTIVSLREGVAGLELLIDEDVVRPSELGARTLDHAIRNNPALDVEDIYAEARIFLRADQNTAYSNVVNVMSELQEAGFVKVGIFAERAIEG